MWDIEGISIAPNLKSAMESLHMDADMRLLAGGTDILVAARAGKLRGIRLLSVGNLPELQGIITDEEGNLVIGAGETFSSLIGSTLVREKLPTLVRAAEQLGSVQIRRVATIGGNLCNGAVSADSAAILYALDAELLVSGFGGERVLPVRELHKGPGKTSLEHDEVLTAIRIPKEKLDHFGAAYFKYGRRNAMEIATLGCAAAIRLSEDGERIRDFALAFTVAAPTPLRCVRTEGHYMGEIASESLFREIAGSALTEIRPRSSWRASGEFRMQIAYEMAFRCLTEAAGNWKRGCLC